MILARLLNADPAPDLDPGFARLGLPTPAREYLLEKIPLWHVLLTGLVREDARLLRARAEDQQVPGREAFPAFVPGDQKLRPGSALLSGRKEQFEHLAHDARQEGRLELAAALERLPRLGEPPAPLSLGEVTFEFGRRPFLMGVVNVTPDSFSDVGRYFEPEAAIARGLELAEAGAQLLDVGGESTRPGAEPVPVAEELRRVVPVIRGLRAQTTVPLSVDTRKAEVARQALEAGATLVNDVSGFQFDPQLPKVVAEAGAACCVMHIRGTPETMQQGIQYQDAVEEILAFLSEAVERGVRAGIPRERIVIDPGIGFGKTFGHNHFLLRRLRDLRWLGLPILVGASRKGFLGALTGGKPAPQRNVATAALMAVVAASGGADFVRVHDVQETKDALAVADAVRHAHDGGTLFSR